MAFRCFGTRITGLSKRLALHHSASRTPLFVHETPCAGTALQQLGFALKDKNWGAFLPGARSPWSVARSIPEAGSRDHHDHSRKAGRRGGKSPRTRASKPRSIPTFPFGRPSAPTARWTVPSNRIDEQSQPLHEFDGMSAHPTTSRFTLDRAREALARVKKITAEKNRIHHHWFVAEMLTQASQRCRPR